MEFTPINTEEEFLNAVRAKYGDVDDLQGKINTHVATIADLQGKVKGYEDTELKRQIAKEKGIPMDMAARLSGDDEKALRADADALAANLRAFKGAPPMANHENAGKENGARAGLRNLLRNMKGD